MDLSFRFGAQRAAITQSDDTFCLHLTNMVVKGEGVETWPLNGTGEVSEQGLFKMWRGADQIVGLGVCDVRADGMCETSNELYAQLLELSHGYSLHRIWNFIPMINEPVGEVDQYMLFCKGRAEAFSSASTVLSDRALPAASAVGTPGESLWVVFVAGSQPAETVENPMQTPAYQYPRRYGPRAPSFARGARLNGGREVVVSGTASIRESESLNIGDALAQSELALDNIGLVLANADFESATAGLSNQLVSARVYLRDPELWPQLEALLRQRLAGRLGSVNVLQAEICRPELLVEIEAHFRKAL